MSLDQFTRQLQRELQRNTKKTVMLGLLLLAAMYFWVPLLVGKKPEKSTASQQAAIVQGVKASTPSTPKDTTSTLPADVPWTELAKLLTDDAKREPGQLVAALVGGERDPFALLAAATDETATSDESLEPTADEPAPTDVAPPVERTPENLRLVLGGTIVGRTRVATINGKSFREQATIVVRGERTPDDEAIEFTLARVHADHVILARDGKEYPLRLASTTVEDERVVTP